MPKIYWSSGGNKFVNFIFLNSIRQYSIQKKSYNIVLQTAVAEFPFSSGGGEEGEEKGGSLSSVPSSSLAHHVSYLLTILFG